MKKLAAALIACTLSANTYAWTLFAACDLPTERTDGSRLPPEEIAGVRWKIKFCAGEEIIEQTPLCEFPETKYEEKPCTIAAATLDTHGLLSLWSDEYVLVSISRPKPPTRGTAVSLDK